MEFWNDRIIEKSWKTLLELNERYEFILIGGWATYLHTKSVKSKDIDIITDYDVLEMLKLKNNLKKNQRVNYLHLNQRFRKRLVVRLHNLP